MFIEVESTKTVSAPEERNVPKDEDISLLRSFLVLHVHDSINISFLRD